MIEEYTIEMLMNEMTTLKALRKLNIIDEGIDSVIIDISRFTTVQSLHYISIEAHVVHMHHIENMNLKSFAMHHSSQHDRTLVELLINSGY
jgi:hypothetical protein